MRLGVENQISLRMATLLLALSCLTLLTTGCGTESDNPEATKVEPTDIKPEFEGISFLPAQPTEGDFANYAPSTEYPEDNVINRIGICIETVRTIYADGRSNWQYVNQYFVFNGEGKTETTIPVPMKSEGTIKTIKFDLKEKCDVSSDPDTTRPSFKLKVSDSGVPATHTLTQNLELRFEGEFISTEDMRITAVELSLGEIGVDFVIQMPTLTPTSIALKIDFKSGNFDMDYYIPGEETEN